MHFEAFERKFGPNKMKAEAAFFGWLCFK